MANSAPNKVCGVLLVSSLNAHTPPHERNADYTTPHNKERRTYTYFKYAVCIFIATEMDCFRYEEYPKAIIDPHQERLNSTN